MKSKYHFINCDTGLPFGGRGLRPELSKRPRLGGLNQLSEITIRILRYKPGHTDPPKYQNFTLEVHPDLSVLDCMEKIRLEQDSTLMYRHSCHHASCGTCACKINGTERLACTTRVKELNTETITLEPLDGFPCLGDLVVDMQKFFEEFSEEWTYLKQIANPESTRMPSGLKQFTHFENCIECGACVSACPVNQKTKKFIGPAALSAINIEIGKHTEKDEALISLAGSKRGVTLCEQALNCSRVCPTGVYPARHIEDLRMCLKLFALASNNYLKTGSEKTNEARPNTYYGDGRKWFKPES